MLQIYKQNKKLFLSLCISFFDESLPSSLKERDGTLTSEELNLWKKLAIKDLSDGVLNSLTVDVKGTKKFIKDIVHYNSDINTIKNNKEEIIRLQLFLQKKVSNSGVEITGDYDSKTKNAVEQYRKSHINESSEMSDFQRRNPAFRLLIQQNRIKFEEIKKRVSIYKELQKLLGRDSLWGTGKFLINSIEEKRNINEILQALTTSINTSIFNTKKVSTKIEGWNNPGSLNYNWFGNENLTYAEYIARLLSNPGLINELFGTKIQKSNTLDKTQTEVLENEKIFMDSLVRVYPNLYMEHKREIEIIYKTISAGKSEEALNKINRLTERELTGLTLSPTKEGLAKALRAIGDTTTAGQIMHGEIIQNIDTESTDPKKLEQYKQWYRTHILDINKNRQSIVNAKFNEMLNSIKDDPSSEYYYLINDKQKQTQAKEGISALMAFDATISQIGGEGLGELTKLYDDMKGLNGPLNLTDENAKMTKEIAVMVLAMVLTAGLGEILALGATLAKAGEAVSVGVRAKRVAELAEASKKANGIRKVLQIARLKTTIGVLKNTEKVARGVSKTFTFSAQTIQKLQAIPFVGKTAADATTFTIFHRLLKQHIFASEGELTTDLLDFQKTIEELGKNTATFGMLHGVGSITEGIVAKLGIKGFVKYGPLLAGDMSGLYILHLIETERYQPTEQEWIMMGAQAIGFRIVMGQIGKLYPKTSSRLEQIGKKNQAKIDKARMEIDGIRIEKGVKVSTGVAPKSVLKRNARLNDTKRIEEAERLLGRELTNYQKHALLDAHNVKIVEEKISLGEIRKKYEFLKNANYTREEIQILMDKGIAGRFGDLVAKGKAKARDFVERGMSRFSSFGAGKEAIKGFVIEITAIKESLVKFQEYSKDYIIPEGQPLSLEGIQEKTMNEFNKKIADFTAKINNPKLSSSDKLALIKEGYELNIEVYKFFEPVSKKGIEANNPSTSAEYNDVVAKIKSSEARLAELTGKGAKGTGSSESTTKKPKINNDAEIEKELEKLDLAKLKEELTADEINKLIFSPQVKEATKSGVIRETEVIVSCGKLIKKVKAIDINATPREKLNQYIDFLKASKSLGDIQQKILQVKYDEAIKIEEANKTNENQKTIGDYHANTKKISELDSEIARLEALRDGGSAGSSEVRESKKAQREAEKAQREAEKAQKQAERKEAIEKEVVNYEADIKTIQDGLTAKKDKLLSAKNKANGGKVDELIARIEAFKTKMNTPPTEAGAKINLLIEGKKLDIEATKIIQEVNKIRYDKLSKRVGPSKENEQKFITDYEKSAQEIKATETEVARLENVASPRSGKNGPSNLGRNVAIGAAGVVGIAGLATGAWWLASNISGKKDDDNGPAGAPTDEQDPAPADSTGTPAPTQDSAPADSTGTPAPAQDSAPADSTGTPAPAQDSAPAGANEKQQIFQEAQREYGNAMKKINSNSPDYLVDPLNRERAIKAEEKLRQAQNNLIQKAQELGININLEKGIKSDKGYNQEKTDKKLESSLKDNIINDILKSESYNYRTLVLEAINNGSISNITPEQKAFIRKLKLHKEHSKIRDYLNDVEVNVNNGKLEVAFTLDSDGDDDAVIIGLDVNNGVINHDEFISKFKEVIKKLYDSFDKNNPKKRIIQDTIRIA